MAENGTKQEKEKELEDVLDDFDSDDLQEISNVFKEDITTALNEDLKIEEQDPNTLVQTLLERIKELEKQLASQKNKAPSARPSKLIETEQTDLAKITEELHDSDDVNIAMTWSAICQCVKHEMWDKLSSRIKALLNEKGIDENTLADTGTVNWIMDRLEKRNIAMAPRKYTKQLMLRAIALEPDVEMKESQKR